MPATVEIVVRYRDDGASARQKTAADFAAIGHGADQAGSAMAATGSKAERLTKDIASQQRELGLLQRELSAASEKYGASSVQAQRKQLAVDKLTASIKADEQALGGLGRAEDATGQAADKAGKATSRFGEITTGALRRVGELAVNALMTAGQAILGFVSRSVQGAADYESSMNMFQTVTGASAEQMAAAGDLAKQLGSDLTLPATSAASAGAAMTELAKAGLSVDQAMAAAKGTLQLAAAGGLEEADAAEIAANALNSFGLTGRDAAMVADLLAAAANASSSEVSDMALTVKQGGGIYSAFQGPVVGAKDALIDFTAAASILSNAGIKGASAGTYLAQALQQLTGPSDKAAALMRQLAERVGVSGDIAFDASGKMRPLKEIVDLTSRATAGLSDKQRDFYLTTIFGAEGMKALLPLMRAGTQGWDDMRASVTKQNAAADLAAARMKGLNGAVEGLGSQLETLALEGMEPLLPILTSVVMGAAQLAGSFTGKVGPAVQGLIGFVTDAGNVILAVALPALSGLTTATAAYAVVQAMQATPAMLASIPVILEQAAAFAANALTIAAAVAPYALIAAAIAGVVYAYQNFQNTVRSATDELLASKPFWTDAGAAIENYGNQTGEAAQQLAPYAASIGAMREQIRGEIEDLGRRMAAGMVSDEQYAREMATINQHTVGLQQATAAYNGQAQAILRNQAASMTGTAMLAVMDQGEQQLAQQTELTKEEFEKLEKQLKQTFQEGSKAVSDYVNTELGFMADLEKNRSEHEEKIRALVAEKQKAQTDDQKAEIDQRLQAEDAAYTTQQQKAAVAYATEQAAQRAHLGQMLGDYTIAQFQMGNITRERATVITATIEQEFGVQKDLSGRTFLAMTADINNAAQEGGAALQRLGSDLGGLADDAVETKSKMEALKGQYTAELVQNFLDGKIDAEKFRKELQAIPPRVYSEVTIVTRRQEITEQSRERGQDGGLLGRASGGPVYAGTPYIVGERGPELFVPGQSGAIVPNEQLAPRNGSAMTTNSVASTSGATYVLNYHAASASAPEEDVRAALRMQMLLQG